MTIHQKKLFKKICWFIFIIYILLLTKIILFKYINIIDLFENIFNNDLNGFRSLNFIPFQTLKEFILTITNGNISRGIINLLGNILVFAPMGWFIPLLFPKHRQLKKVLFIGILLSLLFEISQYYFYLGSADIDDVILNDLGVILGFLCFTYTKNKLENKTYAITITLSIIGFIVAFIVGINYFGIMFGQNNTTDYDPSILESFNNMQIETNAENQFDILADIVSIDGDQMSIRQVMEVNENVALSGNENKNLQTIHLLPSTQYSQLNIYDQQGQNTKTQTAGKNSLQDKQRIDIKGYIDNNQYFATEIIIYQYLF